LLRVYFWIYWLTITTPVAYRWMPSLIWKAISSRDSPGSFVSSSPS
jgi:hypothetical protein